MSLHSWLVLHTIRWPLWVTVSIVFSAYVVWARGKDIAQPAVPWLALSLCLMSAAITYANADWRHVLQSHPHVWFRGLISMAAVASVPLLASLGTESIMARRATGSRNRFIVTLLASLLITFLFAPMVSGVAQRGLSGVTW